MIPSVTLNQPVAAAGKVLVSWQGGIGPFQLQRAVTSTGHWHGITNPIMRRQHEDANIGEAYFRVEDAVSLLDADLSDPATIQLFWCAPELN